jgi:hypothetical protein
MTGPDDGVVFQLPVQATRGGLNCEFRNFEMLVTRIPGYQWALSEPGRITPQMPRHQGLAKMHANLNVDSPRLTDYERRESLM